MENVKVQNISNKSPKMREKLEAIMAENFPEVFKMPVLKERSKNPKLGKDI